MIYMTETDGKSFRGVGMCLVEPHTGSVISKKQVCNDYY